MKDLNKEPLAIGDIVAFAPSGSHSVAEANVGIAHVVAVAEDGLTIVIQIRGGKRKLVRMPHQVLKVAA